MRSCWFARSRVPNIYWFEVSLTKVKLAKALNKQVFLLLICTL